MGAQKDPVNQFCRLRCAEPLSEALCCAVREVLPEALSSEKLVARIDPPGYADWHETVTPIPKE